jgi:hypothetical protein
LSRSDAGFDLFGHDQFKMFERHDFALVSGDRGRLLALTIRSISLLSGRRSHRARDEGRRR